MLENVPYSFEPVSLKFPEEIKGLVSIIVPIYNTKESYILEALDSVIAQTFENWEVLLINDGSTDETVEKVCTEYTKKDSRFKYICKKCNEGSLLARKTGLENSRGEFIANLDSDDAYHTQFLEKMFAKIKETDCDFIWCGYKRGIHFEISNAKFSQNKLENCLKHADFGVPMWNKFIKRDVYAKILFPQLHLTGTEDIIQFLQIIYQSEQASHIPDMLYLYRDHTRASADSSSWREHYVSESRGAVAIYLLMKQLFNTNEAEKNPTFMRCFLNYFLFSKEEIIRYKMEYVENFIPAFLRGIKKSKNIKFFKKIIFILTGNGYTLPYKIYCKYLQIRHRYIP
jgi:glycosyltransferase involved in cell wall biosynthesis